MSYGLGLGIIDLELGLGVPVISIIIIPMVIVPTYGAILTVSVVWLLFVMLCFFVPVSVTFLVFGINCGY